MTKLDQVREIAFRHLADEDQSLAHRRDHIERVMWNAKAIANHYQDIDLEILELGVLLHDIHQPYYDKQNHVDASAELARRILSDLDYPTETIARVVTLIKEHSTETIGDVNPTSMEAKILFDADKLDGVGASGVLRVFLLFHQMGKTPADAIPWYRDKIKVALENMQTDMGRAMLSDRLELTLDFLSHLEADLSKHAT